MIIEFNEGEEFMREETISIIVLVYNIEQYLSKCLDSIVNQNYRNLEIIIIDDGSTDSSKEICDIYAKRDERIKVIHQKNSGPGVARKVGVRNATGKYIGFVDGDDYIDKNMYINLMDSVLKTGADVVHTSHYNDVRGSIYKVNGFNALIDTENEKNKLIRGILGLEVGIEPSIWSKLFKTELIKKSIEDINDECSYGEDLICLISTIVNSKKLAIVDSAYYYYCIRKSSCSHKKDKENILQEIRLWYNVVDVLKKYSLYEIFYDDVINFLNKHMVLGIERASSYEFVVQKYLLSNVDKFINKKIVIWGAGSVGKSYYSQLCRYSDITIIAWIDKCLDKNTYNCMTISKPEIIEQLDYDYIIIAIKDYNNAKKIYEEIGSYGVKNEKVFWEKPMFIV